MTTETLAATDILIYRTLAAARGEGQPELVTSFLDSAEPRLVLNVESVEDSLRWQEWFTRHVADDWTYDDRDVQDGYRYHHARSSWRGWQLDLVHLTDVELEAGVSGD